MKIWQKSLIALGTIGTAASGVAVGLTIGYNNYDYKTHISRGSFSTRIPDSIKGAKTYYAKSTDSYDKIVDINTDTNTVNGSSALSFAKNYLAKNGVQPIQVVEFAGTRFINDIPLYIQTQTFMQFISWFVDNGEYGPELSALDFIKLTGETNNSGTLGAFKTDNKTSDITYYIGQFLGGVKVASKDDYTDLDEKTAALIPFSPEQSVKYKLGLMYKFNKTPLSEEEVLKVASSIKLANSQVNSDLEIYSVNFAREVNGKKYFDVYIENSKYSEGTGASEKVESLLTNIAKKQPSITEDSFVPSFAADGITANRLIPAKRISPNANISTLDVLDAGNKIPNGISIDFLKYTILHEYGHHQLNTSQSKDSSEQPVKAKPTDQSGLSSASDYINIDALNDYFSARIPELKAVRMNSLMHVAPAHTDPANYPFVVLQWRTTADAKAHLQNWNTMTPQQVFDLKSDLSLGAGSLTEVNTMAKIKKFATDNGITTIAAITLINMDVWNSTATPKFFYGSKSPIYIEGDGNKSPLGIEIVEELNANATEIYDATTNNISAWIAQFKDSKDNKIFDLNKSFVEAHVLANKDSTPGSKNETIWPESFNPSDADTTYATSSIILYSGDDKNPAGPHPVKLNKEMQFTKTNGTIKIPSLSDAALAANGKAYTSKEYLHDFISQLPSGIAHGTPFVIDPTKLAKGDFVSKAILDYFNEFNDLYKVPTDMSGAANETNVAVMKTFATEDDAYNFVKSRLPHMIYSYITKHGLHAVGPNSGSSPTSVSNEGATSFTEASNLAVMNIPTNMENAWGYETSLSEILTRDYVQMLYENTYGEMTQGTPGAVDTGMDGTSGINSLVEGTSLRPSRLISKIDSQFTAYAQAHNKLNFNGLKTISLVLNSIASDLLDKLVIGKKGMGLVTELTVFGQVVSLFNAVTAASPLRVASPPPGIMYDLRMRQSIGWELYNLNGAHKGEGVEDTSIAIRDLQGNLVTNRAEAMWMYTLHQKGIYGTYNGENMDRTIAGVWHNLDKDAYTMWGYIRYDADGKKARYLTFEQADGTKKSFPLNLKDNIYYHTKQFDDQSKVKLEDLGYKGWSIDYKTMGTYASADLPTGEYKVYFSDESQQEIPGLFSMGKDSSDGVVNAHRNYVANNNFFYSIASVYFKDEKDGTKVVVKDYL